MRPEHTAVVELAKVPWDHTWQSDQDIAAGLAARGFRVVFVNPMPGQVPPLRDLPRMAALWLGRPGLAGQARQPRSEGVAILRAPFLPDTNAVFRLVNARLLVGRFAARVRQLMQGAQHLVVLTGLPFPTPMALTRHLDPDLLVYACFTNWAGAGQPRRKVLREGELLRQAALVVTNSPLLYERLKHQHPCVRQWPGSVDSHFLALASTAEVVASHRDLPLCCYYGSVRPAKIDLDLLAKVSERYALRLVGPVRGDLPPLGPNSELRGMVAHQEAPLHLRDVDVLVLPYLLGDLTSTVMPAKLFECLATGRPIVSTRLPSLEPYANLLYLSDSHAEFLQNIERALHEPAQRRDERIRIAGENTTDRWMDALSAWIMEAPCHRSVR